MSWETEQDWKAAIERAGRKGHWALHTALTEGGPQEGVDYKSIGVDKKDDTVVVADGIIRETLLAGMTDLEIAEIVGREFARRGKTGVLYMIDETDPKIDEICFALAPIDGHFNSQPFHKQLLTLALHAESASVMKEEKSIIIDKAN